MIFIYMDLRKKTIIKNYIKKLLRESGSEEVSTQSADDTTLQSQLSKKENKPFPIGPAEQEAIKSSIKSRFPDKGTISIDNNNTVTFEIPDMPKNFNCTLRKIANKFDAKQSPLEFKYVLWKVPFKGIEDLGKEQSLYPSFSDPFDNALNGTKLTDMLKSFLRKALLTNNP